jgi:hypothetical protein
VVTFLAATTALLLAAGAQADPKLVGTWTSGGETFMALNADGTGRMEEGPIAWTASGGVLSVKAPDGSTDRVPYQVAGDKLTLSFQTGTAQLTRTRGPPTDPGKTTAGTAKGAAAPFAVPPPVPSNSTIAVSRRTRSRPWRSSSASSAASPMATTGTTRERARPADGAVPPWRSCRRDWNSVEPCPPMRRAAARETSPACS